MRICRILPASHSRLSPQPLRPDVACFGRLPASRQYDRTALRSVGHATSHASLHICPPLLTANLAFISTDRAVYALDLASHKPVWQHNTPGKLALSDGTLFIVESSGTLRVINVGGDTDQDGLPDWWENLHGLDPLDAADGSSDPDQDTLSNTVEFTQHTDPQAADSDLDGLSDGEEVLVRNTDPTDADTDDDTLVDGQEVAIGTDPLIDDTDADGLSDGAEVLLYRTNPLQADSDQDGMTDAWELEYALNPLSAGDANSDPDRDGLNNVQEFNFHSNPRLPDTDEDSLNDGEEVSLYTTDPANEDTDGDHMIDGWEIAHALNPLDPQDAAQDPDGDGHANLDEFYASSDPQDAADVPTAPPWTNYQANASHTGYVPLRLDPTHFQQLWQKSLGEDAVPSAITVEDGRLFLSVQLRLQARNTHNGALLWEQDFGDVSAVNPPTVNNGTVYIQSCNNFPDSFMWRYRATDGTLLTRTPYDTQWQLYNAPTLFAGDAYVPGGYENGVYSFDGDIGSQNWFVTLSYFEGRTPAVDQDYVYAYGGKLTLFDRLEGTVLDEIEDVNGDADSVPPAPVLSPRGSVLVLNNERLLRFDLSSRQLSWELAENFSGQSALANDIVYAYSHGDLVAVKEQDGQQLWLWLAPQAELLGAPLAVNNLVFVSSATTTYAIDLALHTSVWSIPTGGQLALSEGLLFISSPSGTLTAVSVLP